MFWTVLGIVVFAILASAKWFDRRARTRGTGMKFGKSAVTNGEIAQQSAKAEYQLRNLQAKGPNGPIGGGGL
ncbi:MAG: hypothetical protein JWR35_88 [Marmoricola sp.]|jgi:hypothetical protein|nr:hypothetical protein [Marmoricola sp.]